MNKVNKRIIVFLNVLAVILLTVFCSIPVYAVGEEAQSTAQVLVTGYKASSQSITPGKDFTLTITLKNYSKSSSAENVIVTLNNPAGVVPQYGTVCAMRIDTIKANSTADVTFKLTSDKELAASNLNFNVGVVNGAGSISTQISVPVTESPEVCVTGYEVTKTPIVPGDEFTITLTVKNFSKRVTAKDIVVTLSNPSGVIPEYGTVNVERIESIGANETAEVDFTFTATSDLTANELYFTATISGNFSSSNTQFSIPIKKIAQLYVAGYEVTDTTIVPGNDFTLRVKVKNPSNDVTVKNVLVMITNPTGVIPQYGEVGTAVIESLEPGSIGEVSFRYSSDLNIKTSDLNFGVGVFYDNLSTSTQIRVPVGRMADFAVEEVSVPEQLIVGKAGYASAMMENLGETGVSNVVMVARCNGKDIATANIGTISAKTVKTQSFSLMFEEVGQYAVDLVLTYTNGEGQNKEFLMSSGIVQVVEEEDFVKKNDPENAKPVDTSEPEQEEGNSNLLLLSVSGILLIGLCCVILILLYRRKK